MKQQTKTCQNCEQQFTIEPEDFDFYKKVKVPPPTWCQDCRLVRRFLWRNERTLYKRKCNAPGHSEYVISMYAPDKEAMVYDTKYWWSDNWDMMSYGQEYDFSLSFFEQFRDLQRKVPRPPLVNNKAVHSKYCNFADENKNCYLVTSSNRNEDSFYGFLLVGNKNISDCLWCSKSEFLYECIDCQMCYNMRYSQECKNCMDSIFLIDCKDCSNCIFCVGLRNKSYYIFNHLCSKKEYHQAMDEILGSHKKHQEAIEKFKKLKQKFPIRKSNNFISCNNVSGDFIFYSNNIKKGFDVYNSENCAYLQEGLGAKESYDICFFDVTELCYESTSVGLPAHKCLFTIFCRGSHNLLYCDNCHSCNNCFGCVSLRNKEYCILNKQYTKKEYETLIPKIIQHMNDMPYVDKKGKIYKYGEFFPPELSPFTYNETIAQEYFPLTKEQAIEQGYTWKDLEKRDYEITIKSEDLPDHIKDMKDDILKQIIGCAHNGKCNEQCTTAFKVIPDELQFYRKMNLPLPRLCSNCRHYQRLKQRNPLKLWHRTCQCAGEKSDNKVYQNTIKHFHGTDHCPNEFETTYAPERKEIVYCEKCYQSEVV
ncbi:hypothetical protein MYX07_01560 [Patescibacteria group bacterium AH-259-L07]|nr:hypothetical protein [Patescibacteria group bacterium AH-259-L07]